jgi:hypothetical protein
MRPIARPPSNTSQVSSSSIINAMGYTGLRGTVLGMGYSVGCNSMLNSLKSYSLCFVRLRFVRPQFSPSIKK